MEYCNYGNLRGEFIRDRIVVGIRDSRLSEKLQLDEKLTLEKAATQARQSTAVKQQQAVVRNDSASTQNAELDALKKERRAFRKKHSRPKADKQANKCSRCGYSPHPRSKCPANQEICRKCGMKGHFAKMCLSKSVGFLTEQDDDDDSGDDYFLGSVDAVESKPWTASIKIHGRDVRFKIDTGADVTVIPATAVLGIKLQNTNKPLSGPANSKLNVVGKFKCKLVLNGVSSVQDIYMS